VQVDPIKPRLKPLGTKRLKLECGILLSTSAFKFNLRRYTMADGYAVRAADCPGTLVVAAGSVELNPGEAACIAAGAAVPAGADAVVPAAGCDKLQCPWAGAYIRPLFGST